MKLTTPEQINTRLRQWYDPDWHLSVYRQMNYAFGEPWNKNQSRMEGDKFPDFGDISIRYQEVGRSRRIINNQLITLARVMYADPEPLFPQVDKFTGEVRKQFYKERYKGQGYGDGYWGTQHVSAFLDGDGMGAGFLQFSLAENKKTRKQFVTCTQQPLLYTIWDRNERDPGRARGIAFVKYIPVDVAEDRWGVKEVKDHIRRLSDSYSSTDMEMVRVIEYFDLGYGLKGHPTRAIIPSDIGNQPWEHEPNEFECLPFSYYLHFLVPGLRRPMGRVALQMQTQEMLNQIEKSLNAVSKKAGVDLVDIRYMEDEDVKRYNNGQTHILIRLKDVPPGAQPWIRIQAQEAAQTLLELKSHYERQFNADSGVTDFDRGVLNPERRTLGENQILDQRAQVSAAWAERAATHMHIGSVEKALHIAKKFDRDPVMVDIESVNVPLNVPGLPQSFIDAFLEEPSRIEIGTDQLKAQDVKAEKMQKFQLLREFASVVNQPGGVTMEWFTKQLLEAYDEKDPEAAMMPAQMPGMMPPAA